MHADDFSTTALNTINESLERKNRVSMGEFSIFIPLFQLPKNRPVGQDYDELSREFMGRFDLYAPIYIFAGNPEAEGVEPIQTVPPLFVKTKDTSTQNRAQLESYDHFDSATRRKDINTFVSGDLNRAAQKLYATIDNILDPESLVLAQEAVKQATEGIRPTETKQSVRVDDLFTF